MMFDEFKRTILREDIKYEIFRKFFHIFSLIVLVFYRINFWIGLFSNILFMILYLSSEIFRITEKKILFFKKHFKHNIKNQEKYCPIKYLFLLSFCF